MSPAHSTKPAHGAETRADPGRDQSGRLLNNLSTGGGGTALADAIAKPRLNVLLVGSDAGPDRTGARTDTMMMASIDTATARTTLFALPRNIGYAQFPPGTQFPKGFHDAANPLSGNYLLNAVYAWGLDHAQMAPTTPTTNPGLKLLHETIGYMMGVDIDYYVEVNMAASRRSSTRSAASPSTSARCRCPSGVCCPTGGT